MQIAVLGVYDTHTYQIESTVQCLAHRNVASVCPQALGRSLIGQCRPTTTTPADTCNSTVKKLISEATVQSARAPRSPCP